MEREVVDFYKGAYQRPILGDRGFIEWVKQRLGDRAKVGEEKEESARGGERGTVHGDVSVSDLGGHRHSEIGRVLGLEKISSVSSACFRMKARVGAERRITRRARKIEEELQKSQERT